jgi:hypothetical protein
VTQEEQAIRLPFFGGAYEGRAKSVNAERCLNFYPEKQGEDWILVGTPGLTLRVTLATAPHRGEHFFNDRIISVSGSGVYSIDSNHNATLIGTIATTSSRVSMADNGTELVLVDGSSTGYHYDGTTFEAIADVDFAGGTMVTYQDGYFIVCEPNSGRFRHSDLHSATIWIETDFGTAEGLPDKLRAVLSDHRELWLGGIKSTEVFYNSGDPDAPFTRNESGFIEKGIAAGFTLAKHDNSLVWLSEDDRGKGLAVSVDGNYRPTVISPTGINWQWAQYSTISDAFAFTYQIEGHEFYVLTFPTANRTWVLDAASKQWHQWSSNLDGNEFSRHRANTHVFAFGRHYVGDYASGKLYTIEPNVYTEDGALIIRDRIGQHADSEEQRIPIREIQIAFEEGVGLTTGQGSDPQAMLRWSKDGARTWSNELWKSVGKIGEYGRRTIWRKPGTARGWTFWLRVSDPVKWIVRDAVLKLRET